MELEEMFSFLDRGDGYVNKESVCERLFSATPGLTRGSFNQLMKECGLEAMESLNFAQFFVLVTKTDQWLAPTAEQRKAIPYLNSVFKPFDPSNTGLIDADTFFAIMTEKGDALSPAEAADMKIRLERQGYLRDGQVNFVSFLENISPLE